uniref:Uncharacterized protein n=1 Tax=Glossina brevipalpis TaxID=37001 RepID=A0A1A9WD18_9MUSC
MQYKIVYKPYQSGVAPAVAVRPLLAAANGSWAPVTLLHCATLHRHRAPAVALLAPSNGRCRP